VKPKFGTNPHVLVRTNDPDTSHQAAKATNTPHLESLVFEAIKKFDAGGCIQDEVLAKFPGYPYSSITARFKALLDKELIEVTGERRHGKSGRAQRVLRVVAFIG